MARSKTPIEVLFFRRVIPGGNRDDCWAWTGTKNRDGYGLVNGKLAHRLSFHIAFGVDPGALCVLHKCDNPACANPKHLFLGTRRDNMEDMRRKERGSKPPVAKKGRATTVKGETHGGARLTEDAVRRLRKMRIRGDGKKIPFRQLGTWFGIKAAQACAIYHRRAWAHVI